MTSENARTLPRMPSAGQIAAPFRRLPPRWHSPAAGHGTPPPKVENIVVPPAGQRRSRAAATARAAARTGAARAGQCKQGRGSLASAFGAQRRGADLDNKVSTSLIPNYNRLLKVRGLLTAAPCRASWISSRSPTRRSGRRSATPS